MASHRTSHIHSNSPSAFPSRPNYRLRDSQFHVTYKPSLKHPPNRRLRLMLYRCLPSRVPFKYMKNRGILGVASETVVERPRFRSGVACGFGVDFCQRIRVFGVRVDLVGR